MSYCLGSPLIPLTLLSEHPSWDARPLPVLFNSLCQPILSPSSFSLLPSMISAIISGLYLQPRSQSRDSGIYSQLPLDVIPWIPIGISTTWCKLNSPFQNDLLSNTPTLCFYVLSILVFSPET